MRQKPYSARNLKENQRARFNINNVIYPSSKVLVFLIKNMLFSNIRIVAILPGKIPFFNL